MQNIMQVNAVNKTMSSREIAKLTDKQHGHVIRDIELLNETLAQESLSIIGESFYTADNGQTYREFLLTKEQTIDLMTGYNRNLRVRINRRWADLEAQASQPVIALPDFTNPVTAARAWADELEAKQVAQEQLAIAQPKIDHYNAVVDRHTLLTATQVGQKLGMSAVMLNRVLDEIGVYNKALKRGRAFKQWFIDKGLGEMKQTDMGYSQPLFSLKGEAWVIERLANESVA